MANYIKINKEWTPETNFWELNPQVALVNPFSKAYKLDTSEGKEESSKYMWAVYFMKEPDEEINFLASYEPEYRRELITKNYFPEIDWNDNLLAECLEDYELQCMSMMERALLEERESLRSRARFLRDTEYNKDTAKLLDDMRQKTLKIYEGLEATIEKFAKSKKTEEAKVFGQRSQTISEKGEL